MNEDTFMAGVMCATLTDQDIYIGRKGSYHFRRRQTHSRKTSQLQHMLSLTKTVHLKIINLSSNTLNQTEIMLLSKGLKLSPTP